MRIKSDVLPWPFSLKLGSALEAEISNSGISTVDGAIVCFRDPKWTPKAGGFHTVEIAVSADGCIQYITDFGYFGTPPHCEIGKEIDWDFTPPGYFQHFGQEYPLIEGKDLFFLWQSNFLQYVAMGVYTVTVTSFTGGDENGHE